MNVLKEMRKIWDANGDKCKENESREIWMNGKWRNEKYAICTKIHADGSLQKWIIRNIARMDMQKDSTGRPASNMSGMDAYKDAQ